jgi:hypothetical protein
MKRRRRKNPAWGHVIEIAAITLAVAPVAFIAWYAIYAVATSKTIQILPKATTAS